MLQVFQQHGWRGLPVSYDACICFSHWSAGVFEKKNAGLEFFQRNLCQYHNSLECDIGTRVRTTHFEN